jgi:hypothetical protein
MAGWDPSVCFFQCLLAIIIHAQKASTLWAKGHPARE